jgi:hypothetical protein
MKYTKEDWVSGKVALEWENDKKDKINKFFKECDKHNTHIGGWYQYYFNFLSKVKGCDYTRLPIVKIDDIVMEKEKQLPKYFVIKQDANNPLWNKYIAWYNDIYGSDVRGTDYKNYYGYDGNLNISILSELYLFKNNPTLLTLEEWDLIVNNNKQDNMKEKQIIGYKLIKPEYEEAVKKLVNHPYEKLDSAKRGYDIYSDACYPGILKKAGVLDIWFTPVFKEEKQLPKINGYEGRLDGDYIIYGSNCAKFHKSFFITANNWIGTEFLGNRKAVSIKLDSGVEITKQQLQEIVEFIKEN